MTKPARDPAQVRADLKRRAQTEGLLVAYETSLEICRDKTAPASARSAAAGILMKLAGSDDEDSGGKDLHEMDGAELARYAAELRRKTEAAEATLVEDDGEEAAAGLFG
ncbi:hypothetical protein [Enterovirga sp. CN4-39]|uniref:hypothetical protein n=1 Tax=Enterovirga sp. CN4-39 TaxID=3400910 RepID=UPI003C0CC206